MKYPRSHENYHLTAEDVSASESPQWGIRVTVDELYRIRNEALHLTSSPADAVNSLFPGAFQAMFHGRGLEFDEVRAYQWGDDHRSVDWRVTARTGQMHTKLFHQEKERSLFLLVDCSPRMHFGSRRQFKWVLAARIAAIFAWLAIENGDRVGLILFGHQPRCEIIPPGIGQPAILKIFKLFSQQSRLNNIKTNSLSTLADALGHLRHLAQSGVLALLLSDFKRLEQQARRQLAHISYHHDLAAMLISDPLERCLPEEGNFAISDGKFFSNINCSQPGLNSAYQQEFNSFLQQTENVLKHYAIRLIHISTAEDNWQSLRQALRSSSSSSKSRTRSN